jgi:hypothetical protein
MWFDFFVIITDGLISSSSSAASCFRSQRNALRDTFGPGSLETNLPFSSQIELPCSVVMSPHLVAGPLQQSWPVLEALRSPGKEQ